MALPDGIKLQFKDIDDRIMCIVYFRRKDNPQDSCGYMKPTIKGVRNMELSDMKDFKVQPKSWDEIELHPINGIND